MQWNTPQHNGLHDPDTAPNGMYSDIEHAEEMRAEAYDAYHAATTDEERDVARSNANYWTNEIARLRGIDISEVL